MGAEPEVPAHVSTLRFSTNWKFSAVTARSGYPLEKHHPRRLKMSFTVKNKRALETAGA
jgi:hypothetical protein